MMKYGASSLTGGSPQEQEQSLLREYQITSRTLLTDMDFEPLLMLSHQQSNSIFPYFKASVVKNIDHRESHLLCVEKTKQANC